MEMYVYIFKLFVSNYIDNFIVHRFDFDMRINDPTCCGPALVYKCKL